MRVLNKYDRFLKHVRKLNGEILIKRQSPFNAQKSYEVLSIKNQYPGSFEWILKRIMSMDNQRNNIVGKAHKINKAIRNRREDDRVTRDIANFFEAGGDSIVV